MLVILGRKIRALKLTFYSVTETTTLVGHVFPVLFSCPGTEADTILLHLLWAFGEHLFACESFLRLCVPCLENLADAWAC